MKAKLFQHAIIAKASSLHGYGVFAEKSIKAGEIVEECHTLLTEKGDISFKNYYFDADGMNALPMGFGCIYNHSADPNACYTYLKEHQIFEFKAIKDIGSGQEILVSYGNDWFSSRGAMIKEIPLWRKWVMPYAPICKRVSLVVLAYGLVMTSLKYMLILT